MQWLNQYNSQRGPLALGITVTKPDLIIGLDVNQNTACRLESEPEPGCYQPKPANKTDSFKAAYPRHLSKKTGCFSSFASTHSGSQ